MRNIFKNGALTITAKVIAAVTFFSVMGVWCAGCRQDEKGSVVIKDDAYQLAVLATNENGFDAPDGIFWKAGKLYMADEGSPAFRIWQDAENVETLSDARDGISAPEDVVVDNLGNIYFTDDNVGGVWQIDLEGETFLLAGKDKGLHSTEGIVLSPTGEILVGEGKQGKIYRITQTGEVEVFLGTGIKKPESMVFDEQGNLYIADNLDNVLYLLTPNKELISLIANRKGFSPETIWYADRTLYITDSDHGKLFRYKPETGLETIAEFSGFWKKVCGITTDKAGNIYLTIQTHIDNKHSYLVKLIHHDRTNPE